MRRGVDEGRRMYVLVNNRSEGNAPLTVQALAETLANLDSRDRLVMAP